jgi:hypothetical protein
LRRYTQQNRDPSLNRQIRPVKGTVGPVPGCPR